MPKNRMERVDSPAEAAAKGKFGRSYANELFAQVNNLFYEFGLIAKPKPPDEPNKPE